MRLKRSFFNSDTNEVARELLGKKIVRVFNSGQILEAIITETEAYHGFTDKASHASAKKTERNKVMFEKAGLVYVYLVYGMHYCLNFTTMPEGFPAAVLIRGIALEIPNLPAGEAGPKHQITNSPRQILQSNLTGQESQIQNPKKLNTYYLIHNTEINGPGRVCKILQIDKSFYGEDLTKSKRIWVEDGIDIEKNNIIASKRIGVDYAGECANWEWNYKIDF